MAEMVGGCSSRFYFGWGQGKGGDGGGEGEGGQWRQLVRCGGQREQGGEEADLVDEEGER